MSIAQQITQGLRGKWHGIYGMVCCPVHNDRTPSLKISDSRESELLVYCFGGCDWRDVKDELRRLGFLEEWIGSQDASARHSDTSQHKLSVDKLEKQRAEVGILKAKSVYALTKPVTETLVPVYLRSRGITGLLPPSIRGHDCLYHSPSGQLYPAMVAAVLEKAKSTSTAAGAYVSGALGKLAYCGNVEKATAAPKAAAAAAFIKTPCNLPRDGPTSAAVALAAKL
jgi:hypothetical protein